MKRLIGIGRVLSGLGLLTMLWGSTTALHPTHARQIDTPPAIAGLLQDGVLQWGADSTGGAPYVFLDPKHPSNLIGFEVDIANELAKRLHIRQKMVQTTWDTLPAALMHRRFDMIMNGLEITPDRQKVLLFSHPYYAYTEQIVVRKDNTTIHSFSDLPGRTVGTGSAYKADQIMQDWNKAHPDKQIRIKEYGTDLPFADLDAGRLDAILIDLPIAAYYSLPPINNKLKLVGAPMNPGYYGMAFRPNNKELAAIINSTIDAMIKDGTLSKIYHRWNLWNTTQAQIGIH